MTAKQITVLVDKLLDKYQNCRDSDSDLMIGVLQALGADLSPVQREIIRSVNFESIRRHRQAVQASGMYPASPEVARKRKQKAEDVRSSIPLADTDLTTRLISQPAVDWRSVFPD